MILTAPIPRRMRSLDIDPRGYPIPWNVVRGKDGAAIFTANDDRKHHLAIQRGLCPLCGERLGQWKWFVGGIKSAFDANGCYLDLPAHKDCAEFAMQTCPYLAMPKWAGRVDIPDPSKLPDDPKARIFIDQTMIPERPEVFVMQASTEVLVQPNGRLRLPYVRPRPPVQARQFWRHGKLLTYEQALPFLRAVLGKDWNLIP